MDVEKIYQYALKREEEGYQFFKGNADSASHAAVAGVFHKLAEEELGHIEYLKNLLANLSGQNDGSVEDLEGDGFFEERAQAELMDQSIIESMIPDVAVLRTAWLIEHDLAEFYQKAADKAEGTAASALGNLARWERGHEELFQNLHDRVFEEYTKMPWGG